MERYQRNSNGGVETFLLMEAANGGGAAVLITVVVIMIAILVAMAVLYLAKVYGERAV